MSSNSNLTAGNSKAEVQTAELRSLHKDSDSMKRAAAKKLIERYYYQLTDGCGNPTCQNDACTSSGKVTKLTSNQAAAQALHLFAKKAQLCDYHPSKIAKTSTQEESTLSESEGILCHEDPIGACGDCRHDAYMTETPPQSCAIEVKSVPYLTEEKLVDVMESCKEIKSYSLLIRTLGECFSSTEALCKSFLKCSNSALDIVLSSPTFDVSNWKKEDFRQLEGDPDKDVDSIEGRSNKPVIQIDDVSVDFPSLRRSYDMLFKLPNKVFETALINALTILSSTVEVDLKFHNAYDTNPDYLNLFIVVMELPTLGMGEYLEIVMPRFCKAASLLPISAQARLARVWAKHNTVHMKSMVETLQQLVTLKVISTQFSHEFCVNDEESITSATKVLKILYYASILAGDMDNPSAKDDDIQPTSDDNLLGAMGREDKTTPRVKYEDPLVTELGVSVLDSRKPIVLATDFYNEPLSEAIEMDKDYAYYRTETSPKKFSFMNYSFILTPATKALGLYYDNRIRMYSERRVSFMQSVMHGQPINFYLKLKIRRDHIIEDALVELEMVALESPMDLKKQLVVEFEGEQGVDEGGVSKEFFLLIVEEIFKPDYGMFTYHELPRLFWFNPRSFENNAQFTLIGIVLGLAIYNNIILDVRFPSVIYRKLLGQKGTFRDLHDLDATLHTGLEELLHYQENDVEEVFEQTFRISYSDCFGTVYDHDLKENGDSIKVNNTNKIEYVELYADFILNKSIEKQFHAFSKGFQMVTDESPLKLLFSPDELEQLVCGSRSFDFNALEEGTEYDGGYSSDHPVIRNFWDVVHNLTAEDKRKLLQFTTGSDRVPVGGLAKLKMVIAKNGSDTDRLPTAHTCFNILLLPEYENKDKLRDRLLKAINYYKGFGML